jgi:hypothetical protein
MGNSAEIAIGFLEKDFDWLQENSEMEFEEDDYSYELKKEDPELVEVFDEIGLEDVSLDMAPEKGDKTDYFYGGSLTFPDGPLSDQEGDAYKRYIFNRSRVEELEKIGAKALSLDERFHRAEFFFMTYSYI